MKTRLEDGAPVDAAPIRLGRWVMARSAVLAAYTVVEMCVVFLFTSLFARYLGAEEFGAGWFCTFVRSPNINFLPIPASVLR